MTLLLELELTPPVETNAKKLPMRIGELASTVQEPSVVENESVAWAQPETHPWRLLNSAAQLADRGEHPPIAKAGQS